MIINYPTDWLRKDNAERLAHRIRMYWKIRGRNYNVRIEPINSLDGERLYVVRSDIAFRAHPNLSGNNIK